MKEFILTLVGACLFCGLAEILSPDGNSGEIKKHIRLISSLCVLCIMAAPAVSFARQLREYNINDIIFVFDGDEYENKYDEICNESITAYTAQELEGRCGELISEKLGLSSESFDITVDADCAGESITVSSASVTLYPEAITQNPREISSLVENLLGCECEIIYG